MCQCAKDGTADQRHHTISSSQQASQQGITSKPTKPSTYSGVSVHPITCGAILILCEQVAPATPQSVETVDAPSDTQAEQLSTEVRALLGGSKASSNGQLLMDPCMFNTKLVCLLND